MMLALCGIPALLFAATASPAQAWTWNQSVYKWTGSTWVICRSTDWTYGTTGTSQWGPTGPGQVFDYGGASSCGPGFYGTMGYPYVSDGSTWRGGGIWSGAESVS